MRKKIFNIAWLLALVPALAQAQDTLTLDAAIAIALEQNYGITVAKNDAAIAENTAAPGNAGLLPEVYTQAGASYSNNNTNQVFAGSIPPNEVKGAENTSYNAAIGVRYMLFDGLGTVYGFQRLKGLAELSDAQARLLIENTLLQVVQAYLVVARAEENYLVSVEALAISKDRYNRTQGKYDFGGLSRIDLLNSEVDMNTDSVNMLNARVTLLNARRDLNLLLGRPADTEYAVKREVPFSQDLILQELRDQTATNNAALMVAAHNLSLANLDIRSNKSNYYPTLNMDVNYGYNYAQNEAGILLNNETYGLTAGITLNWSIFNGKQRIIQVQNAKIALESSQTRYNEVLNQVDRDVLNAYTTYQNNLLVLQIDLANLETAELNFDRSRELYNLGQLTSTQFREAQLNLINAQLRIANSRLNAKLAEVELLRLSGRLMVDQ